MSLKYLWDKLEDMSALEQQAYIKNIFIQFNVKPIFPIEDNFKNTPGKEVESKNPLGYIVMHLDKEQLQLLIPKYLNELCEYDTFNSMEIDLINITKDLISFIRGEYNEPYFPYHVDRSEYLKVFKFGRAKYSDYSFLKLDPYTLVPAVFRHLYKFLFINSIDSESHCGHVEHACSNIRMIKMILKKREAQQKQCQGIDCAWCLEPDCPREKRK